MTTELKRQKLKSDEAYEKAIQGWEDVAWHFRMIAIGCFASCAGGLLFLAYMLVKMEFWR